MSGDAKTRSNYRYQVSTIDEIGNRDSILPISELEAQKMRFAAADSWKDASEVVWTDKHQDFRWPYYQHYTTLDTLVNRILQGEWWMTRSDAVGLNDLQESRKFGLRQIARRTYQISFSQGSAESAAMWALYSQKDPFAVRILLPKAALSSWINGMQLVSDKKKSGRLKIKSVEFHDIVYAAIPFVNVVRDRFDKERGNGLFWAGAHCDFRQNKGERAALAQQLQDASVTGWVKDYEWRHEFESRLCVRVEKASTKTAVPVVLPPETIARMSFTLSPWLDRRQEVVVQKIIKSLLAVNSQFLKGELTRGMPNSSMKTANSVKTNREPLRRSVLQGALNFKTSY